MKTEHIFALGLVFMAISAAVFILRPTPGEQGRSPVPEDILTASPAHTQPAEVQEVFDPRPGIKAALDARTPAQLTSMMTEKITVTRYGTDCCGVLNKQQVSPQFAFIGDAEPPWDFEGESTMAAKLQKQFENDIIGITGNGYAVAIHVNTANLIDSLTIITNINEL